MHLARVLGKVISSDKYPCYHGRKLMFVQRLSLDNHPVGSPTIAIDYVGAGEGETVIVGAAPGLAAKVFDIPPAPMRELIMGIVDRAETNAGPSFGADLPTPPSE